MIAVQLPAHLWLPFLEARGAGVPLQFSIASRDAEPPTLKRDMSPEARTAPLGGKPIADLAAVVSNHLLRCTVPIVSLSLSIPNGWMIELGDWAKLSPVTLAEPVPWFMGYLDPPPWNAWPRTETRGQLRGEEQAFPDWATAGWSVEILARASALAKVSAPPPVAVVAASPPPAKKPPKGKATFSTGAETPVKPPQGSLF